MVALFTTSMFRRLGSIDSIETQYIEMALQIELKR